MIMKTKKMFTIFTVLMFTCMTSCETLGGEPTDEPTNNFNLEPTGTIDGYDYVDLGLSVKWATYNVGATCIEEIGEHYAWGETTPYDEKMTYFNYYWDHIPCSPNHILSSIYDAATVNWGNSWRMPTYEEQEELIENCDWTWVDNINSSKISGYVATSKKNKKSIFIPAGQFIANDDKVVVSDRDGMYWSSWVPVIKGQYVFTKGSPAGCIKFNDTRNAGNNYCPPVELHEAAMGYGLTIRAVVGTPNDFLPNGDTITIDEDETKKQGFSVSGKVSGYTYVDLGLPSRTLWATYNVGATLPHEYGDMFAWGETRPKESYLDTNYIFFIEYSDKGPYHYAQYSKYTWNAKKQEYVDGKEILDAEDDAATVNWGEKWCMPTREQIDEIATYCNVYREDIIVNDQKILALRIESKLNDNVMVLPFSGIEYNNYPNPRMDCWYWTREVYKEDDYKAYFYLLKNDIFTWDWLGRNQGLPVRAVVKQ